MDGKNVQILQQSANTDLVVHTAIPYKKIELNLQHRSGIAYQLRYITAITILLGASLRIRILMDPCLFELLVLLSH